MGKNEMKPIDELAIDHCTYAFVDIVTKSLEEWFIKNMPEGTVIGDPKWWARKIVNVIAYTAPEVEQDPILYAENDALRNFARSIIFPSGEYLTGDLDGDYVESMARKYGLLELKIMNERCGENCVCADYDAEFPTACNRATGLIKVKAK